MSWDTLSRKSIPVGIERTHFGSLVPALTTVSVGREISAALWSLMVLTVTEYFILVIFPTGHLFQCSSPMYCLWLWINTHTPKTEPFFEYKIGRIISIHNSVRHSSIAIALLSFSKDTGNSIPSASRSCLILPLVKKKVFSLSYTPGHL